MGVEPPNLLPAILRLSCTIQSPLWRVAASRNDVWSRRGGGLKYNTKLAVYGLHLEAHKQGIEPPTLSSGKDSRNFQAEMFSNVNSINSSFLLPFCAFLVLLVRVDTEISMIYIDNIYSDSIMIFSGENRPIENIENIKNILTFFIYLIFWYFRKYHDIFQPCL